MGKKYYSSNGWRMYVGHKARLIVGGISKVGTLEDIEDYGVEGLKSIKLRICQFRMDDGTIVRGDQCWWLPLEIAEKAESGE